jgi:hypothetical protein
MKTKYFDGQYITRLDDGTEFFSGRNGKIIMARKGWADEVVTESAMRAMQAAEKVESQAEDDIVEALIKAEVKSKHVSRAEAAKNIDR